MSAFDPATDIRILREPTVYLTGRQTVDAAEVERFLADHGVSWQTDTEVAGEHLAEIAGRLRYLSLASPRPAATNAALTPTTQPSNARGRWHFTERRARRHAEVEIRKLAVQVLRLMQVEAPTLFGDSQLTPLPDGTFEATTPNRKV